jgi:hypothetical protein
MGRLPLKPQDSGHPVHVKPATLTSLVADLHRLGIQQALWRYAVGLQLAPHGPTTPGTMHDAHDLEERRGVSLPAIRERQGHIPPDLVVDQ